MPGFTKSSDLKADVEELLKTLNMRGVNDELRPLVRMTCPNEWQHKSIYEWPENQQLFSSWILLLGVLPVDRHVLCMQSLLPGQGFIECSSSFINERWHHTRRVIAIEGGCSITDEVDYQSRLPLLGHILKPVYRLVFWRRHRNLRSRFGKTR